MMKDRLVSKAGIYRKGANRQCYVCMIMDVSGQDGWLMKLQFTTVGFRLFRRI